MGAGNISTNTCLGNTALDSNTTGSENTAIGSNALTAITIGTNCTAVGNAALSSISTTSNCTAIGRSALSSHTGGDSTAIGFQAALNHTTGTNITAIGYGANPSSNTVSNEITLGNASIATLRCQVTSITALSDRRDKKDIQDLSLGLAFINRLRPVNFTWNRRDGSKSGIKEAGFIAQELDEVQNEFNAEHYLNLVLKENPEKLEASPGKLLPIMVKAIQELSKINRQLTERILILENK
jgi:hypothetical protein